MLPAWIGLWTALSCLGPGAEAQSPPPVPLAVTSRHAPTLNGRVEGSVQVLSGESIVLNGSAVVQGDLLVPGTPRLVLNGNPSFQGTLDGTGSAQPAGYSVTLNGGAALRYLRRRTDPVPLAPVPAPPAATGTRSVVINGPGQSAGDWSTVRDLTLNANAGLVMVPPGTYRNFTASGGAGFILGAAGGGPAGVYNFEQLTLNGGAPLQVAGPVVVNVGNRVQMNGGSVAGSAAQPSWLALNVARNGVTLNGATLHGPVRAPAGTVSVNAGTVNGSVTADRLVLNSGTIRALAADTTPPALAVTSPADGTLVNAATIEVVGTVSDEGAVAVTINGFAAAVSGAAWNATLPLQEGDNTLEAVATDGAGNRTVATLTVTRDSTAPEILLTSPAEDLVSPTTTVGVFGTVQDASPVSVLVEGLAATLEETVFLVDLELAEGQHTLRVEVTDAAGNRTEAVRTVTVDATPPVLSDLEPAEGTLVAAREVTVRGRVADRTQVAVQVGSVAAAVAADGSFIAAGVPLAEGENVLAVTATDRAGLAVSVSLTLLGKDLTPPAALELFPVPGLTRQPFLTLEGRAEPGSMIRIAGGAAPAAVLAAGGSGLFAATVELRPGANDLTVSALDGGGNASPSRSLTVVHDPQAPLPPAGSPSYLNLATGDGQRGLAFAELPRPLIAVVKDRTGAPVAGVEVAFQILAGEGSFADGNSSAVVLSDVDGYARVRLVAGGPGPQLVRADFAGNLFAPVVFAADALAASPGQGTSVSGVVRDVNLRALPNVLVRLGGQQTRTGGDGRFRFDNVPAGPHQLLELIGRDQVPYPGRWPNISYDIDVVTGIENHLGRPLFLPKVNDGVPLPLNGDGEVTADTAVQIHVAGGKPPVRITALAGTRVTFPPDATDKRLSVTRIPASRIPMALEDGRATNLYISVQPAGALFDPPLRISFPNLDDQPAGTEVLLMSFDHDAGRYVQVGTARVSADGRTVESLPGSGIRVGAWHATPPNPPGRQVTALAQLQVYGAAASAAASKAADAPPLAGKHIDEVIASVYGTSAVALTPRPAWHSSPQILLRASFTIPGTNPPPVVKYDVEAQVSDPEFSITDVTFSAGYDLVSNDRTKFKAPHWTSAMSGTPAKVNPVAYVAGKTMRVAAKLKLSKEVVCDSSGKVDWKVAFDSTLPTYSTAGGNGKSTLHLPSTALKCDPKKRMTAELEETAAKPAFAAGFVNYANPLTLPWKVTLKENGTPQDAGSSSNPLYVTLAQPAEAFHTVVHVASAGLEGKPGTDKDAIFNAIWPKFKTLGVKRIEPSGADGPVMLYWGPTTSVKTEMPEFFHTWGLMKNADGRCGAWKRFLQDVLLAQGIREGKLSTITPLDLPAYSKNNGWLSGVMIGSTRFRVEEGSCDAGRPGPPPPGQGGLIPPGRESFSNHALLDYKGKLYDPSYGNDFPDLSAWENFNLYAVFYQKRSTSPTAEVCHYVLNASSTLETEIKPDNNTP